MFSHAGFAINIAGIVLSIATVMAGILSIGINGFLQAVNYLSPLRYVMRNLGPYTLDKVIFTCDTSQQLLNGTCTIATGMAALEL